MVIRYLQSNEVALLDEFLYQAIFVPKGATPPPRDIIRQPELQLYIENFGQDGDCCLVAEEEGQVIGAVWVRHMKDYGHIDDKTPSLAISILPVYRGKGIGTSLMNAMLSELRTRGLNRVSLSVQKANYAFRLYQSLGFETIKETEEEYIMLKHLENANALKHFGLAAILLRLITIVMHLLVICKVLPYTWVSGGMITDYDTAAMTAGASIVILLTSIAIYAVACEFLNIKLFRWIQIALLVILILNIPFDVMGVILQFQGTNFERHITSILATILLIADGGVAILYHKKLYNGRKNHCSMRE